MINAIIVDDDVLNIEFLKSLILKYCPEINVIAEAETVDHAIECIIQKKPKLIFLDIEIHNKTGFDLLKSIDVSNVYVIMITAHKKYAIQAIKSAVTDYLLKPIQISELIEATNKVIKEINKKGDTETPSPITDFLALPSKNDLKIKSVSEIIRLEAKNNYTKIVTISGEIYIISKTLKQYEEKLPKSTFIRVHKSHIINLNHVERYIRTKNGSLLMKDNTEVPISAQKKNEVSQKIIF